MKDWNLPRFFIQEEPGELAILKKEDLKHIKVLRLKAKDEVVLLDGRCGKFKGIIEEIDRASCVIRITKRERQNPPPIGITLVQGLPKHPKMDRVIEMVSGLSVKRIIPLMAKRSIAKKENIERLKNIAKSSFLTSYFGLLPIIEGCLSLDEAIEMIKGDDLIIVPYEEERKTHLKDVLTSYQSPKSISIFIGPEGGFEEGEIEKIQAIGGISVSLGENILKTEYAGFFTISAILYEFIPRSNFVVKQSFSLQN